MSQSLIVALQEAARLAASETDAAAARQRAAETMLALAVAAGDDAARQRRVLDDAVMQAQAAEDVARGRLGEARSQLAATERQIEAAADRAAGGDDPAGKSVARLEDTRATQAQLVRAHERRTQEAETAREAAEAALAAHDLSEAERQAELLETAIAEAASRVDSLLAGAIAATVEIEHLIGQRRALADILPFRRVDWTPLLFQGGGLYEATRRAFYRCGSAINRQADALGRAFGVPMSETVRQVLDFWGQQSGAPLAVFAATPSPEPDPPPHSKPAPVPSPSGRREELGLGPEHGTLIDEDLAA